ncbi:MAG: T9SS type A sorting domain-containing protein [Aureispira sp.]|nr:T9SS type A sorting domain-containing protein [Aureispira sp.]
MKTIIYIFFLSFVALQANATNYYSTADGDWLGSIWSTIGHKDATSLTSLPCKFTGNDSVFIEHAIISSCGHLEIGRAGGSTVIVLKPNATFQSNGALSMVGAHFVVVQVGTVFNIHGDLNMLGTSEIQVDGVLQVFGDVTMGGNSTVCGTGSASYTGNLTTSGNANWCDILPVEFSDVTATLNPNSEVKIWWTTESETNNNYFNVEQSYDGISFETIAQVEGNGTSNESHEYSINHLLSAEINNISWVYYRVKQTDYDGSYSYSKVVAVSLKDKTLSGDDITIYPNPAHELFYVESDLNLDKGYVAIYNVNGTAVAKHTLNGNNRIFSFETNSWAAGMYVVVVQTTEHRIHKSIIIR